MNLPSTFWWATAAAGVLLFGDRANAGWVVITNDTPAVLILQESPDPAAAPLRPKSVRLLPGEVYREFHVGEGKKTVQVFDARTPDKPIYRGTVTWSADEVPLTLEPDGTKVKLVPSIQTTGASKSRK